MSAATTTRSEKRREGPALLNELILDLISEGYSETTTLLPTFRICIKDGSYVRGRRRYHVRNEHRTSYRPAEWTEETIRQRFREPTDEEKRQHHVRTQSPEPEDQYYLISQSGVFAPYNYSDEADLQRLVESNVHRVFGDETIYLPAQMRVRSRSNERVIDGLFLDLTDPNEPAFSVVEYELRKHGSEHIVNQVKDIFDLFQDKANWDDITRPLYEQLRKSPEMLKRTQTLLGTKEVHERIDKALSEIS